MELMGNIGSRSCSDEMVNIQQKAQDDDSLTDIIL